MSEYLPFWPKAAMGGYIANANSSVFYSRALPTNGFTEVVIQLQMDATFGTNVATSVGVKPQVSNDGVNWKDQTSPTISILANGTFPAQVTEKFTEIGAFMRMKVTITNTEGAAGQICATMMIAGTGRS